MKVRRALPFVNPILIRWPFKQPGPNYLVPMSKTIPQVCQLSHSGFRMLGEPLFRLSEGGRVPSMVVQLDNQDAVLPIRSVAREFGIESSSADGEMLSLIEQALEFVVVLRLGDRLPSELNGGEASWEPAAQDRRVAGSRLRRELVRCVFARLGKSITLAAPDPGWEDEPANRQLLDEAIAAATVQFGNADTSTVTDALAAVTEELACIETMRRALTRGIAAMQEKLLRFRVSDFPNSRRDTLHQVQDLARRGLREITRRLDEVDARLDDTMAMLRDPSATIAWLRGNRDWLYRTNHAWTPVFTDWASTSGHVDEFLWKTVERTYAFLAPRFMSYKEWTVSDVKPMQQKLRAKVW
jgi:hypothetical protein